MGRFDMKNKAFIFTQEDENIDYEAFSKKFDFNMHLVISLFSCAYYFYSCKDCNRYTEKLMNKLYLTEGQTQIE
jgi:hypothetical protein